jgi:hypothetical protein
MRPKILKAYRCLRDVSTAKVQLVAHWFYVEDFEKEIELEGYLGMFELANVSSSMGTNFVLRE